MCVKSVVGKRNRHFGKTLKQEALDLQHFFLTFFFNFLKIRHFYLNPIYNSSELDF